MRRSNQNFRKKGEERRGSTFKNHDLDFAELIKHMNAQI